MKYFVFGDVHGFYTLFINKLRQSGFDQNNQSHMLISLGDNFDRGKENYEMFCFLKKMKEKNKIILLRGNHEDLMLEMFLRRTPLHVDVSNGTYGTIQEFSVKYFGEENKDIFKEQLETLYAKLKEDGFFDLIYDMKDYYETNKYIFTHGFIPVIDDYMYEYNPLWREERKSKFASSRWYNGMDMSINYHIGEKGKKIVVGHWHCSYGNVRKKYKDVKTTMEYRELEYSSKDLFDIYEDEYVIAVDACTVLSGKVNILVVEE